MIAVSGSFLAIANAIKNNTLEVYTREGRFGTHAVIADDKGVIETPDTIEEANEIVTTVKKRIEA